MKKLPYVLLIVLLFLILAAPVLADNGQGQVIFPGSDAVVGSGEVIHDDVVVMGGSLDVQEGGRIEGSVTVMGGNSTIDGTVTGDLAVIGGNLELRPHAIVEGDLVSFGGNVSKATGATVRGETVEGFRGRISLPRVLPGLRSLAQPWKWTTGTFNNWLGGLARGIVNALALMTLGILLVYFLPKQTAVIGQAVTGSPGLSIGLGLLTLLALPFALVILVVICIGIPVAIVLALGAVAAGLYGWVVVGVAIGHRLRPALKLEASPALEVVLGVGLLALLTAVPCLGWLLWLVVVAAGMGAVVLTRFGTMPYSPSHASAEPLPPAPTAPPVSGAPTEEPAEPATSQAPAMPETAPQAEEPTPQDTLGPPSGAPTV